MEKTRMKKTMRQRRLEEPYQSGGVSMSGSQFSHKPAAVPLDEWERYIELTSEFERAEQYMHDIKQRLETVQQQLVRQIEDQPEKSLERLISVVPVTALLQ